MNKKLIFKILGIILGIEGVSLLIPFVIALVCRENTAVFGITALLCLAVGLPLSRLHTAKSRLQNRDGYVAVALGWIVLSAFGALPYALSGCCGYVDALFETVSGFTTTGASIFGAPASLPRGIQLWRALTQWLGGMGVLVLLLALMPKLGEGSVNLMKAESPGPISSKLLPRTNDTAKMLYSIYILLTAAETLALRAARMPWFDAVTTALTTISTGGFSVRNESIAYYQSSAVNWIIVVFMFVSSVNFTLRVSGSVHGAGGRSCAATSCASTPASCSARPRSSRSILFSKRAVPSAPPSSTRPFRSQRSFPPPATAQRISTSGRSSAVLCCSL